MVEIGNERSNVFWEKHCKQERLQANVERDIRESFIRAKYQDRSWIPQPTGESEALSKQLLICVASNNLMRTIQLLVHGADVSHTWEKIYNLDSKRPYSMCILTYGIWTERSY